MAENKTEKATPKKREDSRKKGQVARSVDINGAAVMLASLFALSATAPKMMENCRLAMLQVFNLMKTPQVVNAEGIGTLFWLVGKHVALAAAPIMFACMLAGTLAGVA